MLNKLDVRLLFACKKMSDQRKDGKQKFYIYNFVKSMI